MQNISSTKQNMPASYMTLKLFIDSDDQHLIDLYNGSVSKHNSQMLHNPYPDAGFDIFTPEPSAVAEYNIAPIKINFKVKASAVMTYANGYNYNTGFFMSPRSSLSSTNLRLANSIGIIDSGYRGNLIGKFDCLYSNYQAPAYSRLVQIVAPNMAPIFVQIVSDVSHLGSPTARGEGGFGSTDVEK